MHGRTTLARTALAVVLAAGGLLVAAPPSEAATTGMVTFTGRVTVTPNATAAPQRLDFCFSATPCVNAVASTGEAHGAVASTTPGAGVVDGLGGSATYVEGCGAAGLAPTGDATITVSVHSTLDTWSPEVTATWRRTGTVATITGQATGLALFIPLGVPACGQPLDVLVVGSAEVAY